MENLASADVYAHIPTKVHQPTKQRMCSLDLRFKRLFEGVGDSLRPHILLTSANILRTWMLPEKVGITRQGFPTNLDNGFNSV